MDRHTLYTGQLAYRFSNIDYPFNEFPDSVTGENRSASVRKKKARALDDRLPQISAHLIEKEIGPDAAVAFVKHLAICNPDDHGMMMLLATVMPHDQVIFVPPLPARRPPRPGRPGIDPISRLVSRIQPNYDLRVRDRTA